MSVNYPGSLDTFVPKTDGPDQKIMAEHVNKLQEAAVAIETELGTDPAGSLTDLKTRLAVMLTAAGGLIGPQQIRTVAKSGASYTTITAAIASISDAAANKIYTVLVFPGSYDEAVILKDYVDIIAVNPETTKILREVTDNNVACHCYLNINIESAVDIGLYIRHAGSVIIADGNISSSSIDGVWIRGGTVTLNGIISSSGQFGVQFDAGVCYINNNVSSSVGPAIMAVAPTFIKNSVITSTLNTADGHGIDLGCDDVKVFNSKIVCTHANAKSINAGDLANIRCMGVWGNRDLSVKVTNLITGGFTYDSDVQ